MLRLFLLRHGKAANPEGYASDFDRPLNKKGVAQLNQLGCMMQNNQYDIEQIISSSAKRTEETAQIVNHFLGGKKVNYFEDLYLANHSHIFGAIQKLAKGSSVLYVGHNFGISDIASYLSGENISMSTGMLVELSFDMDDWQMITMDSAQLIATHTPNVLIP